MFNFQVVQHMDSTMAWLQDGDVECAVTMGSMPSEDGQLTVIHGHVRVGNEVTAVTSTYRTATSAYRNGIRINERTFTV